MKKFFPLIGFIVAVLLAGLATKSFSAEPSSSPPCPWDADCLSWTIATTRTDGSVLASTAIASHKIEIAKASTGPWTTLTTVLMPATTYQRRPVTGTNFYRVLTVLDSGLESTPSKSASSTVVEPLPNPPVLKIVSNVGYQLYLGSNNKAYFSRVATVPLGQECYPFPSITDEFRTVSIIKNRNWAIMDPNPKKPGQLFARPRQIWAKCEGVVL